MDFTVSAIPVLCERGLRKDLVAAVARVRRSLFGISLCPLIQRRIICVLHGFRHNFTVRAGSVSIKILQLPWLAEGLYSKILSALFYGPGNAKSQTDPREIKLLHI